MKTSKCKNFMEKYNLRNATMNKFELQRVYKYPKYPRDSKIYSDKVFVNIVNSGMGGSHWTCLVKKDKKSHYFDSFEGQPDNFLPNQLPIQ